MNILQLIDPMVEATNPYNTMLGMSRAIDELPQRVRRYPKSENKTPGTAVTSAGIYILSRQYHHSMS